VKKILDNLVFIQEECDDKYELIKAGFCQVCGEKDKGKQDPVTWEVKKLPEYFGIELFCTDCKTEFDICYELKPIMIESYKEGEG
jgi:hypothetical protein